MKWLCSDYSPLLFGFFFFLYLLAKKEKGKESFVTEWFFSCKVLWIIQQGPKSWLMTVAIFYLPRVRMSSYLLIVNKFQYLSRRRIIISRRKVVDVLYFSLWKIKSRHNSSNTTLVELSPKNAVSLAKMLNIAKVMLP